MNKIAYLTCAILILLAGLYLRFYNIDKVYYEYDDIGVIALQKTFIDENYLNINIGPFEKVKINNEYLKNIEITPFYGLYIAKAWTYAPGQYFIASIFLNKNQSASERHLIVRYLSAIFSILFLLSILTLPFIVNEFYKSYPAAIILLGIAALSQNSIAYSSHASPYAVYMFSMGFGILIIEAYQRKYIKIDSALSMLNLLFIFNYLVILISFIFINIELYKSFKNGSIRNTIRNLLSKKIIISSIPVIGLMMIINSNVPRGVLPPNWDNTNTFNYLIYLFERLAVVSRSIFYGGINEFFASIIGIALIIYAMIRYSRWFSKNEYIPLISINIIIIWILLHIIGKFPLDETRHSLVLLPPFIFIGYFFLTELFRYFNNSIVNIIIIIYLIFIFPGIEGAINYKKERSDVLLNKSIIDKYNPNIILTYESTLSPFIFYDENSDIKIYYLDITNVKKVNWEKISQNSKILLVSHDKPINDDMVKKLSLKHQNLFSNYCIIPLIEKNSDIYFPYNSYPENSGQNGVFIYSLIRKLKSCAN